jgi:hypothetical protein
MESGILGPGLIVSCQNITDSWFQNVHSEEALEVQMSPTLQPVFGSAEAQGNVLARAKAASSRSTSLFLHCFIAPQPLGLTVRCRRFRVQFYFYMSPRDSHGDLEQKLTQLAAA